MLNIIEVLPIEKVQYTGTYIQNNNTSYLMEILKKDFKDNINLNSNSKVVVPYQTATGMTMQKLGLDEAYTKISSIEVNFSNDFADFMKDKNVIGESFVNINNKHFNICLSTEINKTLPPEQQVEGLINLFAKKKANRVYSLLVNEVDFEAISKLKDTNGDLYVKYEDNKAYIFNTRIFVLDGDIKPTLLDLACIRAKINDTYGKEEQTALNHRKGIEVFTSQFYLGLGLFDLENIYQSKTTTL